MAIYRNIQMSFWTDSKVVDDFTPEDRYFYLYLLTNPHTNLAGCYEISLKQASDETGYTKDVIANLLERFERVHNVIRYSKDTKEVLLLNWDKFNWTRSEKFRKPLLSEIESVKSDSFRTYLIDEFNGADTVSIPYPYGSDTTVTVTDTVSDTVSDTDADAVTVKPKQLREEFDVLWSMYPKKQGKEKAFGYYEKARKSGTTYEEVGQGIQAYVEYIKANGIDMQYVKMGSTFFSQKSWGDDWSIRNSNVGKRRGINEVFAEIFEEHKDDI